MLVPDCEGALMPFDLVDAVLPVSEEIRSGLRDEWRRLASAGTWLTGQERVAVATEARAARGGADAGAGLAPAVAEVARTVARAPGAITAGWVRDVVARLPSVTAYVETVGVTARVSAVDTFVRGVGASEEPLPGPMSGEPSREPNPAARQRRAFVPTEGGDGPPQMLSAVPAEARAQMRLHGALYLTEEEMRDLDRVEALSRPQMEFVACRVSYLNDCVF